MRISPKQKVGLDLLERNDLTELLLGGSAGGSKSFLMCMMMVSLCRRYPGTRLFLGRKTLQSLKKSTLNTLISKVHPHMGVSNYEYTLRMQDGELVYKNGSKILFGELDKTPSDPDFTRIGSLEIDCAFIDEAGEITLEAKNAIKSRVGRGVMAKEYGIPGKTLLSCNPSTNFLRSEYYDPYIKLGGGEYQEWSIGKVTIGKEKIPAYRGFLRISAYNNPFLPDSYIDNLKTLPDKERKRLLDGNWNYADDENSLFSSSLLDRTITFNKPEPSEKFNKFIGVDLSDKGCFDDQTEVLTQNGWKLFKDLNFNDKIYVRDKEGLASYQQPLQLHKYAYSGELFCYDTPRLSFAVTPNHKMLARQASKTENQLIEIQDIRWKNWKVCRTIKRYIDDSGLQYPKKFVLEVKAPNGGVRRREWPFSKQDWFEFIGWFAAEGSVVREKDGRLKVNISQKDGSPKCKDIRSMLDRMGLKYTNIKNNFTFYNKEIAKHLLSEVGHLAHNKHIPQYIVKSDDWKCVELFLEGFCKGDGSYRKGRRQGYYSTSKKMLDDIQEILAHFNRAGKMVKVSNAGSKFKIEGRIVTRRFDTWCLTECCAKDTEIGQTSHPVKRAYNGYVYCATTPTGTLYVRREGTAYWTGNSDATIFTLIDNGCVVAQHRSKVQMNWDSKSELPISRMIADELIEFAQRNGFTIQNAKNIALECNGIGNGARDFMKDRGWYITEYTATHKSRSENYYQMMLDFDSGDLKIMHDLLGLDELRKQLTAHTYEMNNQEPSVLKKEKLKQVLGHSPDEADSLMIANYCRNFVSNTQNDPRRNVNRIGF